jgi:hypothetical protein
MILATKSNNAYVFICSMTPEVSYDETQGLDQSNVHSMC